MLETEPINSEQHFSPVKLKTCENGVYGAAIARMEGIWYSTQIYFEPSRKIKLELERSGHVLEISPSYRYKITRSKF